MKWDHFDARESLEKIVDALTPEFKSNLTFDIEIVEDYIKNTKEQLLQEMKEHKQKTQLILVNDLSDKMEHLSKKTIKDDYKPSFEEVKKISQIKRYADAILKHII